MRVGSIPTRVMGGDLPLKTMTKVTSYEEIQHIPDHYYNIGFNDVYETPDNQTAVVPDDTQVPDDWELISS